MRYTISYLAVYIAIAHFAHLCNSYIARYDMELLHISHARSHMMSSDWH